MFSSKLFRGMDNMIISKTFSPFHLNLCRHIRGGSLPVKKSSLKKSPETKSKKIISENRGAGHRVTALYDQLDEEHLDYIEEEELDDERNFFSSHEDYKEYLKEEGIHKKKVEYQITKQKYFKPPTQPNFLTFAEKEHMKFLHFAEPSKWTVETLSESYPALPMAIKKVLRSKWRAKNAEEILRHDKSVQKNWNGFKKGELEVNPELVEHLEKFTSRSFKFSSLPEIEKYLLKKISKPEKTRKIDEFCKIIESHEKIKQANLTESATLICASSEHQKLKTSDVSDDNLSLLGTSKSYSEQSFSTESNESSGKQEKKPILEDEKSNFRGRHFTLSTIRENLKNDLKWEKKIDPTVKSILNSTASFNSQIEEPSSGPSDHKVILNETSSKKKNQFDEIIAVFKEDKKLVMKEAKKNFHLIEELKIQEYIKIPKHLRKKEHLYKVKDCFYDDDGEFLYRVPGLKN